MIERPTYEKFLRDTFPALFASVLEVLSDEEEAAVVAQRLILRAYHDESDSPRPIEDTVIAEVA